MLQNNLRLTRCQAILYDMLTFLALLAEGRNHNIMPRKSDKNGSGGRLIGYARVSTEDQSLEMQQEALREAGVLEDNLHTEKRSGASMKRREALQFAIMDCRDGDTLVVWRLDRLTRSIPDLYELLRTLKEKGVELRSLTEHIDTSTPAGRLAMNTMMSFAQFERESTIQRTTAGIAAIKAKRANGWKWGPKRIMTDAKVEQAGRMLSRGMTGPEVAAHFKLSTAAVYAYWKRTRLASGDYKWIRKQPEQG